MMKEPASNNSANFDVHNHNKFNGSEVYKQFSDIIWRPFIQSPARSSMVAFFFISLIAGAFLSTRYLYSSPIVDSSIREAILKTNNTNSSYLLPDNKTIQATTTESHTEHDNTTAHIAEPIDLRTPPPNSTPARDTYKSPKKIKIPLSCSGHNKPQTCPTNYPNKLELDPDAPPPPTCPDYFRWMYEDLKPWKKTGITKEMVDRGRRTANFRLVILNGKAYVERYQKSWQTRDVFTLWGFTQLLRKYPGKVPDLELMFDCVDWPVIQSRFFQRPNAPAPPPLFTYCADDSTMDIVFPDWSFWGWEEINIKPWELLSKELKEGNKKMKWTDRESYAFWKGNPYVAPTRMDLLKCNVTEQQDWHARVYIQDWGKEVQQGFKQSNLSDQCIYRYKIYIEGSAWSVSEKYILACDSVPLIVKPKYYDFFTRGLMPMQHYWPVKENDKCRSIKYAVEWGNSHQQKAEAIGKAASEFIYKDLTIDYVYDYILHMLNEYAKLLKYKPTIPPNAVELCSETMACPAVGIEKLFMMESLVKGPSDTGPCTMPPPYDPTTLQALLRNKTNTEKQVEKWEAEYWVNQTISHQ